MTARCHEAFRRVTCSVPVPKRRQNAAFPSVFSSQDSTLPMEHFPEPVLLRELFRESSTEKQI
jgi:hypothetical protein